MPLSLLGATALLVGLATLDEPQGWGLLLLGVAGVVLVVTAVGREVALARYARRPPQPRLVRYDGEPALLLPRDPAPVRVVSRGLLGLGLVLAAGAVGALVAGEWVVLVLLAAGAAVLAHVAAPGRDLAGGVWFTPTRVVGEHLGTRWELLWHDVTGAVDAQPMPVLHREDRPVRVVRTGPRGRGWSPVRQRGLVAVDASTLAGGSLIASYVVMACLADPARRAALGTPESLPPEVPPSP